MDLDRTNPGLTNFTLTGGAAAVLLGNFADAVITLVLLQLGAVQELNPLMRLAYQVSPLVFMSAKLLVVSLGLMLLCLNRHSEWAWRAEQGAATAYALLPVYEVGCVAFLHC
jgi:hypothetical protein